jgi:hypothetical protein
MDVLKDIFNETLSRESQNIIIDGTEHSVFFRRNEKGENTAYSTLYAPCNDSIQCGQQFSINNNKYLITKVLTAENTVYQKYQCIRLNEQFKIIYAAEDIDTYDVFMSDLQDSINNNRFGNVSESKAEFMLSLTDSSKRISVNQRFFCGSWYMAYVVTELNYLNGICYVYAERSQIVPDDDVENGIANRWQYEHRPDTYTVSITEDSISVDVGKTVPLTVTVSKNGTVLSETPTIAYSINNTGICSIDSSNIVTGLSKGNARITGSYKVESNDITETDSVDVIVTQPVEQVISVSPAYDSNTYYRLKEMRTTTFTASITGVDVPVWTITLNSNGIPSANYTSTIDNTNGTFTVSNKSMYNGKELVYTISEANSGKTTDYHIQLGGML